MSRASRPLPLLIAGLLLVLLGAAWTSVHPAGYLPRMTLAAGGLLLVWFIVRHAGEIRFLLLQARSHAEPGPTTSLLLVALVLFLGGLVAGRWPALDLTRARINSLAAPTRAALAQLEQPLHMDGFFVQPSPEWDTAVQVLRLYAESSPRVEVGVHDPDRDPARARRLGVTRPGVIVLSYREAISQVHDLTEEGLTQGILRVLEGRPRVVGFIEGHGEPTLTLGGDGGLTAWAQALSEANLETRTVNLLEEGRVPEEIAALLLVHPQTPLFPAEVALVRDYLAAGGGVGLWLEPGDSTGLEAQLAMAYVRLPRGTIRDPGPITARLGMGIWAPALATNPTHAVGAGMAGSFAVGPGVRPVEIVTPHPGELVADPLLKTPPTAELVLAADEGSTPLATGILNVGAVLEWEIPAGAGWSAAPDSLGLPPIKPTARLIVIGDASLVTNRYLGVGANQALAVSAAHWLTWQERFLNIGREVRASSDLRIGRQGLWTLLLVVEAGLPLALVAAGLAVWFRRRARA